MGRYRGGGIQIAITPWDDVYYSYPTFDSLGNELGQKIVKIESDGTSKIIDRFPYIDTSTNYISDLTRMRPIYLPEQKELFFYQKNLLTVYDLDFNYLREYLLPPDFPKITYGVADSTEKLFVGHDGAVYVFDTGFSAKTLTKYLLPDQNVQIESQPTHDQESIIFREKALQTIQELETVEYSIKQTTTGTQSEEITGYGRATHNASHEIYYDGSGNVSFEFINSDNTTCSRADTNWTCNPQGGYSFFSVINNILNGTSPTYYPPEGGTLNTWSELKTYNGTECRSFFVESLYTSTNSKYSDEVCFDIKNYFPIHWITTITYLDNGVITSESRTEAFDLKFNVSMEEIVLPQP